MRRSCRPTSTATTGTSTPCELCPSSPRGSRPIPTIPSATFTTASTRSSASSRGSPPLPRRIKVCVDCIDDGDFINHLIHAAESGVGVQCIVDWRKMTLTNSDNYARLKRSAVDLLGVFCTPHDPLIEVAPDMHTKFVIFGDEDCILGSFNITFDRWGANWESGMTFHSHGVCRLLDNIFQSIRGGVIQRYGIDPLSPFNLLYTFGRHAMLDGKYYRPHQAILAEINRARARSNCLFLIGELQGEYRDSVVDALIDAKHRGVDVHLSQRPCGPAGRPGQGAYDGRGAAASAGPAVARLNGGRASQWPWPTASPTSACPIPRCIPSIASSTTTVIEGSFNWYNTSVFSHDLLVVAADPALARSYLHEFHQILRLFRFPSLSFKA